MYVSFDCLMTLKFSINLELRMSFEFVGFFISKFSFVNERNANFRSELVKILLNCL